MVEGDDNLTVHTVAGSVSGHRVTRVARAPSLEPGFNDSVN